MGIIWENDFIELIKVQLFGKIVSESHKVTHFNLYCLKGLYNYFLKLLE